MLTELNDVLSDLLINRLHGQQTRVGIVVHGISEVDAEAISHTVAEKLKRHLYVAVVGNSSKNTNALVSFANDLESAVAWRNQPDKAGSILVFVSGEADKLASLNFLDRVGPRDLAKYWLGLAEGLSVNQPQERFWQALQSEAALYPIAMLRDFIHTVSQRGAADLDVIPTNLWRLGLLNDSDILDANKSPLPRLRQNRNLVVEAGQLSENNRRRMSSVVSRVGERTNPRQLATFKALLDYYRRGSVEALRQLDMNDVNDLIIAGRALPTAPPPSDVTASPALPPTSLPPPAMPIDYTPDEDDDEDDDMDAPSRSNAPSLLGTRLSGKQLTRNLARRIVEGGEQEGIRELGELIRDKMNSADQSERNVQASNLTGFGNDTVDVDNLPRELYRFVGLCCAADSWGATVEVEEHELRDAVKSAAPSQVTPFDPEQLIDKLSFFETLRQFDQYIDGPDKFSAIIPQLVNARNQLLPHLDLLLASPEVLLGGYPEAVAAISDYLAAYAKMFRLFREYEPLLHHVAHQSVGVVEANLLRLEVINVLAGGEWKALLTPLHPFHLWRYYEILQLLDRERQTITPEQQSQLASVLPDLPHLLHFVVVSSYVADNASTVLPRAGNIGLLPTYENHTNRYLGSDGINVLGLLLHRWLELTPYSKYQIRLALIDVPDLGAALTEVRKFMQRQPYTRVSVDVYYTPVRVKGNDLAQINYEQEEALAELMRSGWLEVAVERFEQTDAFERVLNRLRERPVHIAYVFDQSQFEISDAPRLANLLVSPLVVTYSYEFDNIHKQGSISPSSEAESGLFSDYHYVVERASSLPGGQQLRLKMQRSSRSQQVNQVIKEQCCLWLAVADRNLIPYGPEQAVPLLERLEGQREVGLWASNYSQTMRSLLDLLQRFNLKPSWDHVVDLVRVYGHIAATGLFSVKAHRSQADARTTQQKGLLGTIVAAEWYRRTYPNALIASLDSTMARQWLAKRTEGADRADLIGLRYVGDKAVVEVIEVKSTANSDEVRVQTSRDETTEISIVGKAVEQLTQTLDTVRSIFSDDDEQLFTPARREALRYQLYRESFREQHNAKEQRDWYEVLNRVFSQPSSIAVECRGLVVQVNFEDAGLNINIKNDTKQPITLAQIGAKQIQTLINLAPSDSQSEAVGSLAQSDTPSTDEMVDPSLTIAGSSDAQEEQPSVMPFPEAPTLDEQPISTATTPAATEDIVIGSETLLATQPTPEMGLTGDRLVPINSASVDSIWRAEPDAALTSELQDVARLFRRACEDHGVQVISCDPTQAKVGPSVLRFYVRLRRGEAFNTLNTRLMDISREVARGPLLVTQSPYIKEIILDVPRRERTFVPFTSVLPLLSNISSAEQMPLLIGVTPEGEYVNARLDQMPHLLIGGTTGAGKTMFLYTMLLSLLVRHPDASSLRLLLSTSKAEDFTYFENLPHLIGGQVIDQADEAVKAISELVTSEFEARGEMLQRERQRDIIGYNRIATKPLAPLVIVVDEFADLSDQFGRDRKGRDEFHTTIRRIAQRGRNLGVHLVLCTQRPSADSVPTNIRNLMNTRIALRVNDATASRMILEETGAERLQRYGDMLFKDENQTRHLQGYYLDVEGGELSRLLGSLSTDLVLL